MKLVTLSTSLLVTASAIEFLPGVAQAQTAAASSSDTALEEVVVTAQRRSEDLQRAAASVSVRNGDELLTQGKYALGQILEDVPGIQGGLSLTSPSGTPNSPAGTDSPAAGLTIRGIPSNVGVAGSVTSVATSAAIYVDGVYSGLGSGYDIGRVELLRGPQGTLYGRSATTGVVAIRTPNPDLQRVGAFAAVEAGDYALQHYTGAVNVPLINDRLALRISANRYSRDGYDSADGGALSNTDARLKLLYQPTDDISVLLGYALEDNNLHTGGVSLSLVSPNDTVANPSPISVGTNKASQAWAEFNWNFNDLTLTYLPAFRSWRSDATNIQSVPALHLESDEALTTPKDVFYTHELRLASAPRGRLTWQVGALYYQNRLNNTETTRDGASGALETSSATSKQAVAAGGFGEATYRFTDDWRLTGGLRYDYTKVQTSEIYTSNTNLCCGGPPGSPTYGLPENDVTVPLSGDEGTRRFYNMTYKARLEHDLAPHNLVYLLTTTGFSPGDVSLTTGSDGAPTTAIFKSETLTSYEIGTKNRFFGSRLQANGAVFYYRYSAYQLANVNVSSVPGEQSFLPLSAPARAGGAEAEFVYRMTPEDRVALNLGYTRAYFSHTNDQIVPGSGGHTFAYFVANSQIPGAIPVTVQLSYEHIFSLPGGSNLTLHGDTRFLSAHDEGSYTQPQQAGGAAAYVRTAGQILGNLNASWNSVNDHFSVTAYVRNIGDNRYKNNVIFIPGPAGTFGAQDMLYDPLTFGVVLSGRL